MQLQYNQSPLTQVSMAENRSLYRTQSQPPSTVVLLDLPGHPNLRLGFHSHVAHTRGIVFVVDSTTAARNIRPAAEYLYDVLADSVVQMLQVPILVVCSKQDLLMALSSDKIQTALEQEMYVHSSAPFPTLFFF